MMTVETDRAISDRSDETNSAEEVRSHTALLSHDAERPQRVRVRVGRDRVAIVNGKNIQFGRSLAGALVTVETD